MGKLTSADIAEIEERLRGMRVALLAAVRDSLAAEGSGQTRRPASLHRGDCAGDHGGAQCAPGDRPTREEMAMLPRELDELRGIDDALKRIEFGVGGLCTRCGMQIPLARLRAAPAASTCAACDALAR